MLEQVRVVLVDGERCTGLLDGLEMLADTERSIRVDLPREIDPEFVFFPHFAGIHLVGAVHRLALLLGVCLHHRLTEADPTSEVRLVRRDVVSFACNAHRQHVVGEPCGFTPDRREGHVTPDEILVGEGLQPREAVGVRPDRVVHAREVRVQFAATVLQEMRQQNRQFVVRERILLGPREFVPVAVRMRVLGWHGDELVPAVGAGSTLGSHRTRQHVEEEQRSCRLPTTFVARCRCTPVVRRQPTRHRTPDVLGNLANLVGVYTTDVLGALGGVVGVEVEQGRCQVVERALHVGACFFEEDVPVHPAAHELAVPRAVLDQQPGDGQAEERFGSRPHRQPVVAHRRRVGKTRIDADHLRSTHLALDDALGVRIEVVAGLEVR